MGDTTAGKQFGSDRNHKTKHRETAIQELGLGGKTPVAN